MQSFPKIFALGTDFIRDLFLDEVEITEKIDGSQFGFGKIGGEIITRSKGKLQYPGAVDKLFDVAVNYVYSIADKLPDNTFFYAEYLQSPHHNALTYSRVPKNNLILFGACDETLKFVSKHEELAKYAELLDIEVVPLLFQGKVEKIEDIEKFLELDSQLGGAKIEGFVVKNYTKPFLLGGQPIPLMAGKFVSGAFKEVHRKSWSGQTTRGKWGEFIETYRTEARWNKAIQHKREMGELTESPKDIGSLMKEIMADIAEEEKETSKNFLWKEFSRELLSRSVAGFPEWYKTELMKKSNFDNKENVQEQETIGE